MLQSLPLKNTMNELPREKEEELAKALHYVTLLRDRNDAIEKGRTPLELNRLPDEVRSFLQSLCTYPPNLVDYRQAPTSQEAVVRTASGRIPKRNVAEHQIFGLTDAGKILYERLREKYSHLLESCVLY